MIDLAQLLNKEGVDLEEENNDAGFLAVNTTKTSGGMAVMTQEGLIGRVVEATGLDVNHSTSKSTPCLKAPFDQGCG